MRERTTWTLLGLLLAVLLALAGVTAVARGARAQTEPRLSLLHITVWPEFDKPLALVMIEAELIPDTALPSPLTLRIPAIAGQPYAVASAASFASDPLDLAYDTATDDDSLLVTVETPNRVVRVEFYVPLTRDGVEREFTYVWPGDLAAEEVALRAQIPAGAADFQAEPELGPEEVGEYGLFYRETTLGGLEAGQTLSFRIQYSKEDPRLTVETLPTAEPADDGGGVPLGWPVLGAMAAVLMVGIAALAWYRYSQREPARAGVPGVPRPGRGAAGTAAYCTQCGHALSAGDRFCSRCGAPTRKR